MKQIFITFWLTGLSGVFLLMKDVPDVLRLLSFLTLMVFKKEFMAGLGLDTGLSIFGLLALGGVPSGTSSSLSPSDQINNSTV